jgi:hypothetical protein
LIEKQAIVYKTSKQTRITEDKVVRVCFTPGNYAYDGSVDKSLFNMSANLYLTTAAVF